LDDAAPVFSVDASSGAPVFTDGAQNTAAEPVTNMRRVSFFIFLPVDFLSFVRLRTAGVAQN
jgi:hypothetical protein